MWWSQSILCKQDQPNATSASELPVAERSMLCEPDKSDEIKYIFDESVEAPDNNNTMDSLKPCNKKTTKFIPNIIAKKCSIFKNVNFVGDGIVTTLRCDQTDECQMNGDPEVNIEKDFEENKEQIKKLEDFVYDWNEIYDENNNDLDELVERQNSVEITEKFQVFIVQNYISVGENIPEIVQLHIDDTKVVDLNLYVCPMCEKRLENSSDLQSHLVTCRVTPNLVCIYCSYRAKYADVMKNHVKKRHSSSKFMECPRCHKNMPSRSTLNSHLSFCGKERVFQCDKCTYKTNIKANLCQHVLRIHSSSTRECTHCNKKFNNLLCLNTHLKKSCKMKPVSLSDSCFKATKKRFKLKIGCTEVHASAGKYVKFCPKCLHNLGSSKKMNCCLCRSTLQYQCSKCDKLFDKYSTLFPHLKKCHVKLLITKDN